MAADENCATVWQFACTWESSATVTTNFSVEEIEGKKVTVHTVEQDVHVVTTSVTEVTQSSVTTMEVEEPVQTVTHFAVSDG